MQPTAGDTHSNTPSPSRDILLCLMEQEKTVNELVQELSLKLDQAQADLLRIQATVLAWQGNAAQTTHRAHKATYTTMDVTKILLSILISGEPKTADQLRAIISDRARSEGRSRTGLHKVISKSLTSNSTFVSSANGWYLAQASDTATPKD